MSTWETRSVRSQINLAQFAGYPVYHFDTQCLLRNMDSRYAAHPERLEAVLEQRVDSMLDRADMRIPGPDGFHIIFSTRNPNLAEERANAVCTNILKHFFGTESLIPEGARGFCRPSSLRDLANSVGEIELRDMPAQVPEAHESANGQRIGGKTPVSLIEDMNALMRRYFGDEKVEARRFQFAPLWDAANERINTFCCQMTGTFSPGLAQPVRSAPASVAEQSNIDIACLATAVKGVWQIVLRGQLALIMVPVHIETLSWSKHRATYLHELAHIEPRLIALLGFRIVGLDPGLSLAQLSQGVSALRRHSKRIFVDLPGGPVDFSQAGVLGLTGIGISVPPFRSGEAPLNTLLMVTARLKRICAAQSALAYVDHVSTPSAASVLKQQGVRLIGGPILGAGSDEPGVVGPWPISELGVAKPALCMEGARS